MKARRVAIAATVVASLTVVSVAVSQSSGSFGLWWNLVAGGGGRSTSAGYSVVGGAGQPAIGVSTGNGHQIASGFFPGVGAAVPTAEGTAEATPSSTPSPTSSDPTPGAGTPSPTPSASPTVPGPARLAVNTTDDAIDGSCDAAHCSLREALDTANKRVGPDTVTFAIPGTDPGCDSEGVCTIQPLSLLPRLLDDGTVIDGYTQPGAVAGPAPTLRIVLDGHDNGSFSGLAVRSANNVVRGLVIQRFTPFTGIDIAGATATGNVVEGNFFGTDATGTQPRPNCTLPTSCAAIWLWDRAHDNTIGPGNLIAFNGQGVWIIDVGTVGNTVTRNLLHNNDAKGIALYGGGNQAIEAPTIDSAGTKRVVGAACADCTVEVFSDADDEAAIYEGSTSTDSGGRWVFVDPSGVAGPNITASVTDASGNTSELSVPVLVAQPWELFLPRAVNGSQVSP